MTSMWGKGQGVLLGNTRGMKYPWQILLSMNMCILMTSNRMQYNWLQQLNRAKTVVSLWELCNRFARLDIQPQIHWMHTRHMQLQKHSSSGQCEETKGFNTCTNYRLLAVCCHEVGAWACHSWLLDSRLTSLPHKSKNINKQAILFKTLLALSLGLCVFVMCLSFQ